MEREGISDEDAFVMLKTASQNSNVKLPDVAQRLVEEASEDRRTKQLIGGASPLPNEQARNRAPMGSSFTKVDEPSL